MPFMKIHREVLSRLPGVYSVSITTIDGRPHVLAASERRGGSCLLIDPRNKSTTSIWETTGGTMSLVPVASSRLFAVQKFFAGFDAPGSIIVEAVAPDNSGTWQVRERLSVPYLHRLAAVSNGSHPTLLACTLCAGKESIADWSQPGAVYRIETGTARPWSKVPIVEGIRRNHGLSLTTLDHERVALVSGMEGLFSIALPGARRDPWTVDQLLDWDVSDVVAVDWDDDGREELMTIEPFHGDRFVFYRRDHQARWQRIHEMPCLLGHSLWANRALGRKVIIAGERLGEGRIQLIFPTSAAPAEWDQLIVDRGTGGTNVAVLDATDQTLEFVSANNDNNEVVLYRIER